MKLMEVVKQRNLVAKHAHNMSGAGRHETKKGKKAKRSKQKQQFRKELRNQGY